MKKRFYSLLFLGMLSIIEGNLQASDECPPLDPPLKKQRLASVVNRYDALTEFPNRLSNHQVAAEKTLHFGVFQLKSLGQFYVQYVARNYMDVWNTLSDDSKLTALMAALNDQDIYTKAFYKTLAYLDFTLDLNSFFERYPIERLDQVAILVKSLTLSGKSYDSLGGRFLSDFFPNLSKVKVVNFSLEEESIPFLDTLKSLQNEDNVILEIGARIQHGKDLGGLLDSCFAPNVTSVFLDLTKLDLSNIDSQMLQRSLSSLTNVTRIKMILGDLGEDREGNEDNEDIEVNEEKLSLIKGLNALPKLTHLNIIGAETNQIVYFYDAMQRISQLPHLLSLGLNEFLFPDDDDPAEVFNLMTLSMQELSKLKGLQELNLSSFEFGILDGTNESPEFLTPLFHGLSSLKNLRVLNLNSTHLDVMNENHARAFAQALRNMTQLEELDVGNNWVLDGDYHSKAWVEVLPQLPHLRSVIMDGYAYHPGEENNLSHLFGVLSKCNGLRKLSLKMGSTDVQYSPALFNTFLESLPAHLRAQVDTPESWTPFEDAPIAPEIPDLSMAVLPLPGFPTTLFPFLWTYFNAFNP